MFPKHVKYSKITTCAASLALVAGLYVASGIAAKADCTGTITNKMNTAYSFKVFSVDANDAFTQVQSGNLQPGTAATFTFVASYGTEVVKIYQNSNEVFSATSRDNNLANCNFGRSGGWAPYCLGIPTDQDITILPRHYNCDKSKAQ